MYFGFMRLGVFGYYNEELDEQDTRNDVYYAGADATIGNDKLELNAQYLNEKRDAEAAQRDAERAARDVQDQLAELERQRIELQDELAAARADADQAGKLLEVAKAGGFDPTSVVAMPRIEATVAEVDDEYGFVILDKGRDDQVETGYTFEIHRSGNYLGRVKVDQVYANYSTARIEITAPNARMQRFDRASTYLN